MTKNIKQFKREAEEHKQQSEYGHYRNCLYKLADAYLSSGNAHHAYRCLLKVAYIDCNGPNNNRDSYSDLQNPYFNPDNHGSIAPAVGSFLAEGIQEHGYEMSVYQEIYNQQASMIKEELDTPIDVSEGWEALESEIQKYLSA